MYNLYYQLLSIFQDLLELHVNMENFFYLAYIEHFKISYKIVYKDTRFIEYYFAYCLNVNLKIFHDQIFKISSFYTTALTD